ncbi:hypothetical protein HDF16_004519 [Granulicella aggregans]|uniref:Carboxypeptidase family protein n=1 Tax=Granulicella aggregans TaxID=474949 RepID=A0A7W7ZH21_9BACT|nr:carboxypeptidase-like regulatory domain-containing protein [Granulicella aggregans]MBB5059790.1 hypothetical protein [Granulicella aggregans]
MLLRRYLRLSALFCVTFASVASNAFAQDHSRGRKYKSPPETSHIEVEVVRANNGKPIPNAAVIFNPEKDGKDEGNLEIKTGPDGKAAIDVIPTGSKLRVQVIAGGFATFAEDYMVDSATKAISIKMLRPRAQVSAYVDNSGKASERKPGVQEPVRPTTPPPASVTPAATPDAESKTPPVPETKPNL